jgi:hypothetical protein
VDNLLIVKSPVNTPLEMLMEPDPVLLAFSVTFCDVEKPEAIVINGPFPLVGAVRPNTNARSYVPPCNPYTVKLLGIAQLKTGAPDSTEN